MLKSLYVALEAALHISWLRLKLNCRLTGNTSASRRLPLCQGPTTRQTLLISTRGTTCKASQCPKLISDYQLFPTHVIGCLKFILSENGELLFCSKQTFDENILNQKRHSRNMSGKSCSQNNIFIQHWKEKAVYLYICKITMILFIFILIYLLLLTDLFASMW